MLSHAAQAHADDMVARRYFGHVTPEGATVDRRVRLTGYLPGARARRLGEAIGYATHDRRAAATLAAGFMASASHRGLLLDPGFDELGIGVSEGWPIGGRRGAGLTVVIDLGRSRRAH